MADLLDSCILVDLLRQKHAAQDFILSRQEQPYVCAASAMELLAGARTQKEEARIEALLASFRWCAIDETVFRLAGRNLRHYQSGHGLDVPDALIAATAEHHDLVLATLNVKHFPMFKRLKPAY